LRRAFFSLFVLIALLIIATSVLLLATPSVSNAWSLARAEARAHHEHFPGPPVPARFTAALIATEDHRFASEPGFDPLALGRVLMSAVTGQDQGGSTLYQQLGKLLYAKHKSRPTVMVYELALGIKLKFSYPREQILRMYADVAYFGHGYYGIEQASCGYFGRRPAALSWPQSAVLAGLVQAPSAYDPLEYPDLARSREGHVISRLVATGVLSQHRGGAVLAVPMDRLLRMRAAAPDRAARGTPCATGGARYLNARARCRPPLARRRLQGRCGPCDACLSRCNCLSGGTHTHLR
jgi:membrane peptidoglycan carboxypeptidase